MADERATAVIETERLKRRMAEVEAAFEASEAARPDDGDVGSRARRLFEHKMRMARFAWSPYYPKRLVH